MQGTEILAVFYKQIRCVLEMAMAVWEPGFSKVQSKQIERVQQCAFYIIMGTTYTNYEAAIKFLVSEKLITRRSSICLSFALKREKSEKFNTWFALTEEKGAPVPNTSREKSSTKYKPVPSRTDSYMPCPYHTSLTPSINILARISDHVNF